MLDKSVIPPVPPADSDTVKSLLILPTHAFLIQVYCRSVLGIACATNALSRECLTRSGLGCTPQSVSPGRQGPAAPVTLAKSFLCVFCQLAYGLPQNPSNPPHAACLDQAVFNIFLTTKFLYGIALYGEYCADSISKKFSD